MMHLPFPLHHLSVASGRGRQGGQPGLLYLRVHTPPLPFPSVTEPLPSHAWAPRQPLTVAVELPPPAARCRWQVKISSARRRYWVIFRFTASRRSLLGSTAVGAKGGRQGPGSAPEDWSQSPGGRPSPLTLLPVGMHSLDRCPGALNTLSRGIFPSPHHSPCRGILAPHGTPDMNALVPWLVSPAGMPRSAAPGRPHTPCTPRSSTSTPFW